MPRLEQMLLGYFESQVAAGTVFAPGQTVLIGWAPLIRLHRPHPGNQVGLTSAAVTPREVAELVREGLRAGWQPARPGRQFILEQRAAARGPQTWPRGQVPRSREQQLALRRGLAGPFGRGDRSGRAWGPGSPPSPPPTPSGPSSRALRPAPAWSASHARVASGIRLYGRRAC